MTETSPRDAIDGSELTDFIDLGRSRPWIDKADLVLQTCGIFLVGISFIKLGLVAKGFMFITMDGLTQVSQQSISLDCFEVVTNSPRYLAIFSLCFLSRMRFTGEKKDSLDALQFTIVRRMPSHIAWASMMDSLIRRQLIVTLDDILWVLLMLIVSECLKIIPREPDLVQKYLAEQLAMSQAVGGADGSAATSTDPKKDSSKDEQQKAGASEEQKDKTSVHDLNDLLDIKMDGHLTMKEREKIYIAAELIQKNYFNLHKEYSDLQLDAVIQVFIEKGWKLSEQIQATYRAQKSQQ